MRTWQQQQPRIRGALRTGSAASSARAVGSALASNVITYFAVCVCLSRLLTLCGMLSSCGGCLCLFAQKVAKRQAKQKKRRTCAVSHPHRNDDDDFGAELPVACCGMPLLANNCFILRQMKSNFDAAIMCARRALLCSSRSSSKFVASVFCFAYDKNVGSKCQRLQRTRVQLQVQAV